MKNYKIGDLVGFKWPGHNKHLRVGIILQNSKKKFIVKWFWYDKNFYLENQFSEAKKLNKKYITSIVEYTKKSDDICIEILSDANSSYLYGT